MEEWAEEDDSTSADYEIVGGKPARLRLTCPEGVVTEWQVEGESVPEYSASEIPANRG